MAAHVESLRSPATPRAAHLKDAIGCFNMNSN